MSDTSIERILETIRSYAPDANLQAVMQAYFMAAQAHAGQTRKSGEAYLTHPLAVAKILADMRMDVDTIATALLHDALEDNPMTKEELEAQMGPVVTELVDGVTKIGKLRFKNREELAAENFRKMMLAMSKDLRVILVKLADRLHNMSTLEHHRREKQVRIAEETMEIFVPIANRLGLARLKVKLEDLCFRYLHPEAFAEIDAYLLETQHDREQYTARVVRALSDKLSGDGFDAEVTGRAKHRFSIYRKMLAQKLAVHEVPDLIAFRVLVDDLGQCYSILGFIHSSFPPVPDRIKDYIARPKENGYRALHTTVIGPEGRRIEVQIRTRTMHRIAEEGIAAHWRYKEGHLALAPEDVAAIAQIRELFEAARDAEDAQEFMETVKVAFYSDSVFAFTPAGDIRKFPLGATALDFAYSIHTDVGNHCTGARVNGRLVPLRYALQSGDSVEILTSTNQRPSRDWLDIARTSRAIQKVRRYLRQQEVDRGHELGREMVESELKSQGSTLKRVREAGAMRELLREREFRDEDAMFLEVGRGHLKPTSVVRALLPEESQQNQGIVGFFQRFRSRTESPVLISGEDGVLVHYAGCCSPLPGEPVAGFITRGRGITVHQATCPQLQNMDPDRRIPVQWASDNATRHTAELKLVCLDRPGVLAAVTRVCEQAAVNISRAEAHAIGDDRSLVTLEVGVRDVAELTRIRRSLERIPGVESARRTSGW